MSSSFTSASKNSAHHSASANRSSEIRGALITGGGGFLGSHLAETILTTTEARVICVDNFCTGLTSNKTFLESKFKERVLFVTADVSIDWQPWLKSLSDKFAQLDVSHVFHFASPASPPHYQRIPLETLWVNSLGLKNALEFADSVNARLIFASTSEVYGSPSVHPQPESYWGNVNSFGIRSCYDEAKRFGEALIFSHNKVHHTHHGLVRIFNTYGPRMNPEDGRVIINFLTQAQKNSDLTVFGSGKQTRSFCFVSDLIEGIIRYAKSDLVEPVNLGNDKEFTILETALIVQEMFSEKNLKIVFHDLPGDDPLQRRPDLTKARNLLGGWLPKVELKDGLQATYDWLLEIHK